MFEQPASPTLSTGPVEDFTQMQGLSSWGTIMEVAVCKHCQRRYLLQSGTPIPVCPGCFGGPLEVLPGGLPDKAHTTPPELILPCSVSEAALKQSFQNFCAGVPFPPAGLHPSALAARMTNLFLPMWLIDANVSALWQAEAGFDYQVISHQEIYDDRIKGWHSKEIKEPRVRWEERVGRLMRAYQNVPVPALEDAALLEKRIGAFHQEEARSYSAHELGPGMVRLPDISPKDSWKEVVSALQKNAQGECRAACGADRMREFRWKAQFSQQNWTLMLMPVYATSYQDDEGKTYPVLIHGQTGKITGKRRASMQRAFKESLFIFGAGLLIFLIGMLATFVFPDLHAVAFAVSGYVTILGFTCILASSVPYILAWDFNRKQELAEASKP